MVYQPNDFIIGNGLGDAEALKSLCAEAHKYGVKVIVDVVANHTNGNLSHVAPRLQDESLYHDLRDVAMMLIVTQLPTAVLVCGT